MGRENATHSILFHQATVHILSLFVPDMRCLEHIARIGPANPSELSKLRGLKTGAVTILIARLEKAGLIERKPDPGDRRKTVLIPTGEAMQKVRPLHEPMAKNMFKLMSKSSKEELEILEMLFV